MPPLFKKIFIAFALIIGISIVIFSSMPKPKLSETERIEIRRQITIFNSKLPKKIGTIGQLDKVTFEDDTICYYYSNYGDASIDDFYEENYNEVRELMKYGCLILNGQKKSGTNLANFFDSKGIIFKSVFTTPGFKKFSFVFDGKELLDFIELINISPTEALHTVLDTHIKLANLSLPMGLDDFGTLQSIPNNTIKNSLNDGERLLEIKHCGKNVIFVLETNEKYYRLTEIQAVADNEIFLNNFTSELIKDPDVKEFIDMLVISHSDFSYLYYSTVQSDSAEITIPYRILKNHSTINF